MKNSTRLMMESILCALFAAIGSVFAQGTAFTYQGQLNLNGAPGNGNYDFAFGLYNAPTFGCSWAHRSPIRMSL